jgi:hypothetical protein
MTIEKTIPISKMEVRPITDRQATLFNLDDYQIEPVPLRETIAGWGWEEIGIDLLPNFKNRKLGSKPLPSESPVREQPDRIVLPNSKVREQPLEPNTQSPNLKIVSIKGQKYFLTPSKSTKTLPEGKGWREIKKQKGNLYLYLRWREGDTQKSGCLGRLDKITSELKL